MPRPVASEEAVVKTVLPVVALFETCFRFHLNAQGFGRYLSLNTRLCVHSGTCPLFSVVKKVRSARKVESHQKKDRSKRNIFYVIDVLLLDVRLLIFWKPPMVEKKGSEDTVEGDFRLDYELW